MSLALQEQLLEQCRKLPSAQVREVLDFAEFLLIKSSAQRLGKRGRARRSLRAFVGGISHGALAQNIDRDLYNGAVR